MERLRSDKNITKHLLYFENSAGLKIGYQNCRSLKKHFVDIKQDCMLLQFDILGFVETRISNQTAESFKIDGFKLFCSEYEQSSHGIAIYCKEFLSVTNFFVGTFFGIEIALIGIGLHILGFVHCPPKYATVCNYFKFLSALFGSKKRVGSICWITSQKDVCYSFW